MAAIGGAVANAILDRSSGNGSTNSATKTIYCAAKRVVDRNADSTLWQINSAGEGNLHLFGTTGNGDDIVGVTNWGGDWTDALGTFTNGVWVHHAFVGHSTNQATWYVSFDGIDWTAVETIGQTALTIARLRLFDSGRSENFNGKIAHFRMWDAVLDTTALTAEAGSAQAVRTSDLVSDHRLVGTVLNTVLAGEYGTAFTAPNGGITVDTDEPPLASNDYAASATDNVSATDSPGTALATAAGATDTVTASDAATGAVGGSVGASDSVAATDAVANLLAGVAAAIDNATATDAADGEMPGAYSASATDNVSATDAASYVYTPVGPPEPPSEPYLNRGTRLRVTARINGHLVTGTYEEISDALQQYAKERASRAVVAQRSNRARRSRTRREAATLRQQIDIVDVSADTERIEAAEAREEVFKALRAAFANEYAQSLVLLNSVAQNLQERAIAQQAARQAEEARMAAELAADDAEAIRIAEEFFAEELQG